MHSDGCGCIHLVSGSWEFPSYAFITKGRTAEVGRPFVRVVSGGRVRAGRR
jgi:hypothetical protein